jgi:hypothetical protein
MLSSLIERVRRNHALEHATIHMLEANAPQMRAGGRASHDGFHLFGELPDEAAVRAAAEQAIDRMGAGEHKLAVHPRCGTNLVTTSVLTGALALFGAMVMGKRSPWYVQLPTAILGAMAGALLAQPLGPVMQAKVTTSPHVRGAKVKAIRTGEFAGMKTHFVETEQVV